MFIFMRNNIAIIFVAATLLVGCKSPTLTTTTSSSTASTNAAAATPSPVPPAQTTSGDAKLGNLAGVFLVLLSFFAVKRG
jgi:uncharacterized protein YcfL